MGRNIRALATVGGMRHKHDYARLAMRDGEIQGVVAPHCPADRSRLR